jgi:hypothetical protein
VTDSEIDWQIAHFEAVIEVLRSGGNWMGSIPRAQSDGNG